MTGLSVVMLVTFISLSAVPALYTSLGVVLYTCAFVLGEAINRAVLAFVPVMVVVEELLARVV